MSMFRKILIANRGEIAVRVMRTARRLGIRTVAVYSEADSHAMHAGMADEAYPVGPAPSRESYLVIDRILQAARASGADAVHPGYGFLSENALFAEACASAGVTFIGPPASAIRAMGSKSAAKSLMQASNVPLTPGYHGERQDLETLAAEAAKIGYPVLIKASAGGGGKGMRIVQGPAELDAAILSAKREAASSFGDDLVLIERYLTRPRHIEIQVFADKQGNIVSLFERDCSIQRRHQKVIEEAPAPGMNAVRRAELGEAAKAAARAIGYVGAGTVEFIVEGDNFYFMEMNTRLQVEHPVTEAITRQDLVEWQLRVAAGEPLPLKQEDLSITGHAIEARVYAEDPARDFLPSVGKLTRLRPPAEDAHVRVDTGVLEGDTVTFHYDPMIAKLIVWDQTREAAIRRLSAALAEYEVAGVQTNLSFLKALADHPSFAEADLDTGFIARHAEQLLTPRTAPPLKVLAAAALRVLLDRERTISDAAKSTADRHSPWNLTHAWRLNGRGWQDVVLQTGDDEIALRVSGANQGKFIIELPEGPSRLAGELLADGRMVMQLDGVRSTVTVVSTGAALTVIADGQTYPLRLIDPLNRDRVEVGGVGRLTAPMPGTITQVFVVAGAEVKRGAPLLVIEAMKMEHSIVAPMDGVIASIPFGKGDLVQDGAELVIFEEAAA